MKKIIAIVAMATALIFTGCKKSDFNKFLEEDYAYVQSQYEGKKVLFYEAEITLAGTPADLGKKALPATCKEVFQVEDTVVFVERNYATGAVAVESVHGCWCEDLVVYPERVADYKDALNALLNAEGIHVPDALFVTLRRPLGPTLYENAFYIFGSTHTNFVAVDAKTLEVQEFDSVQESELRDIVEEEVVEAVVE